MPTPEEIRSRARDERAIELLASLRQAAGVEMEVPTLTPVLFARLIVAIENLEQALGEQGRGRYASLTPVANQKRERDEQEP